LPKKSRWVFPTVSGKRHAHIYKIVERVAEKAGVAGAHPHKFRATFLTRLLQSGCDIANDGAAARSGQSLEVSFVGSGREESKLDRVKMPFRHCNN